MTKKVLILYLASYLAHTRSASRAKYQFNMQLIPQEV